MKFFTIALSLILIGCSQKPYVNESFPEGDWQPVNPEGFGTSDDNRPSA